MADEGVELRRVRTGSARLPLGLSAILVGFLAIALATGRFLSSEPVVPAPQANPSGSQPPANPTLNVTSLPGPTRLAPFLVGDAHGLERYVSPILGFSAPLFGSALPSGSWTEGGSPADAGGGLTFDLPAPGDGHGAAVVAVGSKSDPAPVRIPADSGPVHPLWAPSLVSLVDGYAMLLDGRFSTQTSTILGGEKALRFEGPGSAAAVVLAVHAGRVYVIALLKASPSRVVADAAFNALIAGFRFFDPTAQGLG